MTPPAIELHGVGKRYWKIQERSLLRSLVPFGPPNRSRFWALRGVDFSVDAGETIGIVGRNGAGKSTMLRLLAGVSRPTSGTIVTRGRVAPLLSVGVGFHHELTGRENIYVNGMLLGLGRSRLNALFDDIVDFADLAEFIDTPVKFYSSGMFMRLGFAVAVHADPDILLVDEVLAVGDTSFRLRSLDRMRALQRGGAALVFVSHWLQAVQMLCPRAICMNAGRVEFDGATEGALARYHELLTVGVGDREDGPVRITGRQLVSADGEPVGTVHQDELLNYRLLLRFEQPVDSPQLEFRVIAEDSTLVYAATTVIGESWRMYDAGHEATVAVAFQPRFGGGGTFRIGIVVMDRDGSETLAHDAEGLTFFVSPKLGVSGVSDLRASILIDGERRSAHRSARFEAPSIAVEGG